MKQLRIDYDDQPDAVVDKVNEILAQLGLKFKDDGEEHEGFILYSLDEK